MSQHAYVTDSDFLILKSNFSRLVQILRDDQVLADQLDAFDFQDAPIREMFQSMQDEAGCVFLFDDEGNITGIEESVPSVSSYWTEDLFCELAPLIEDDGYINYNLGDEKDDDEKFTIEYADQDYSILNADGEELDSDEEEDEDDEDEDDDDDLDLDDEDESEEDEED